MKRFVKVDVEWDKDNEVWYEYDGDGGYNVYGKTHTLSELISQVPDIENKIRKVLIELRKYMHEQLDKAGIKGTPEIYIEHQVFSILQLFKEV